MPKQLKEKTIVCKVTMPRIVQDNPMVEFITFDKKFHQRVPVNPHIVRLMNGDYEAYFKIVMTTARIVSMDRVERDEYYGKDVQ